MFLQIYINVRNRMSLKTIKINTLVLCYINMWWFIFSRNFINIYESDSIFQKKVKILLLTLIIILNLGDILLKFIKIRKFVHENREFYSKFGFNEQSDIKKYLVIFVISFIIFYLIIFIAQGYKNLLLEVLLLICKN